jgi:hypothetical protein
MAYNILNVNTQNEDTDLWTWAYIKVYCQNYPYCCQRMLTFYDVILSLEIDIFSEIDLLRNAYFFTRQRHKYLPDKME